MTENGSTEQTGPAPGLATTMTALHTKKTAYLDPDKPWVGYSALALIGIVMGAAMVFSFTAITEAAAWSGNPAWALFLAAIMIDGAIIGFALVRAVMMWRGRGAKRTLTYLLLFTGISVVVNFSHAASFWAWDFTKQEAWIGCVIAVAAPVGSVLISEEIIRMVFKARPTAEEEAAALIREAQLNAEVAQAVAAARAVVAPVDVEQEPAETPEVDDVFAELMSAEDPSALPDPVPASEPENPAEPPALAFAPSLPPELVPEETDFGQVQVLEMAHGAQGYSDGH